MGAAVVIVIGLGLMYIAATGRVESMWKAITTGKGK